MGLEVAGLRPVWTRKGASNSGPPGQYKPSQLGAGLLGPHRVLLCTQPQAPRWATLPASAVGWGSFGEAAWRKAGQPSSEPPVWLQEQGAPVCKDAWAAVCPLPRPHLIPLSFSSVSSQDPGYSHVLCPLGVPGTVPCPLSLPAHPVTGEVIPLVARMFRVLDAGPRPACTHTARRPAAYP